MRRTDERVKLSFFLRCWSDGILLLSSFRWGLELCTGRCNRTSARGKHCSGAKCAAPGREWIGLARPGGGAGKATTISSLNLGRYAGKLDRRDFLAPLR